MSAGSLRLTSAPTVETAMLIRSPVHEVFEAFADPAITSRFWFTHSTGRLAPGAEVRWTWQMYDLTTPVRVKEFEQDARMLLEWGAEPAVTTFELSFAPQEDDTTFVNITETGYSEETGDEVVAHALGSMGGFTLVLAALKAYLEHKIVLAVVADRFPDGKPA
ncbi:MAG: hypothetical protein V7603_5529 [Micromonosporaceae bacterium]